MNGNRQLFLGQQPAERRRVGLPEHQSQHINAVRLQFCPERLTQAQRKPG